MTKHVSKSKQPSELDLCPNSNPVACPLSPLCLLIFRKHSLIHEGAEKVTGTGKVAWSPPWVLCFWVNCRPTLLFFLLSSPPTSVFQPLLDPLSPHPYLLASCSCSHVPLLSPPPLRFPTRIIFSPSLSSPPASSHFPSPQLTLLLPAGQSKASFFGIEVISSPQYSPVRTGRDVAGHTGVLMKTEQERCDIPCGTAPFCWGFNYKTLMMTFYFPPESSVFPFA